MRVVLALLTLLAAMAAVWTAPWPAAEAQTARAALREARALAYKQRVRLAIKENRAERLEKWRERLSKRRARAKERLEKLSSGEIVLRREVLAINPSPVALARALALNFSVARQTEISGLDVNVIVLRAPEHLSAPAALALLAEGDPEGAYALNHVFGPSGGQGVAAAGAAVAGFEGGSGAGLRIGMIDAGIDAGHPALKRAAVKTKAFPAGAAVEASPHGTAVASLLVGQDGDFAGALPGAELFAADVFGDRDDGGSAEAIAEALGWLAQQKVDVVNISLAGPSNKLLELVCRAASARGTVLVAAVGNDGPAKPVAFPAAYPGVIAVTAIDAEKRVYVAANRGPEVAFAALGVGVPAAMDRGAYGVVSGTSFAAPLVAARLATMPVDRRGTAFLAPLAQDLGAPGRDPTYGFGAL